MNRKRDGYDFVAVGKRIKEQRKKLNMSQVQMAQKIDRAVKYCSDIECGVCGMSIETMISLADVLQMSIDYMIFASYFSA